MRIIERNISIFICSHTCMVIVIVIVIVEVISSLHFQKQALAKPA